MLTFPKLHGGVALQYPFAREVVSETRVLRFLDGKEQRIPKVMPGRRWVIRYADISETEAARIEAFLVDYFVSNSPFEFTDPATGMTHQACRVESERFELSEDSDFRARTGLIIVEDRV